MLGVVASLLALALTACPASTKLSSVWVNDEVSDYHISDALVVGYGARTDEGRIAFEDRIAQALADHGVTVTTSHELLGLDTELTRDAVEAALSEAGLAPDSVVLGRLIGIEERRTYTPPAGAAPGSARYASLYDVTARDWGASGVPGYYTSQEVVVVETTLWKLGGEDPELVWEGETESFDPEQLQDLVDDLADIIIGQFEDNGYI